MRGYEAFLDVVGDAQDDGAPPEDFGTTWLALELERSADVQAHRSAKPAPGCDRRSPLAAGGVERDGIPRPVSLASLSGFAAVANALAELVTEQRDALERSDTLSITIQSDADQLRNLVEAALAPLVTHRAREHADPTSALAGAGSGPLPPPEAMPPEVLAMLREVKERHALDWLDTPVPALGGKTPRAATKSKAGRERLDVLLREIEMMESQGPPELRGDIGWLRRELGME